MDHPLQPNILKIIGGAQPEQVLSLTWSFATFRCVFMKREDIHSGASGGTHGLLHKRFEPLSQVVVIEHGAPDKRPPYADRTGRIIWIRL
ncbi:MAG: hypothetical protein K9N21_14375 [Deltaproteobacteria bacterium]|nr:hypothetical protein [Deltaproteobacteria bacterium]